jgi:hypothetical protein
MGLVVACQGLGYSNIDSHHDDGGITFHVDGGSSIRPDGGSAVDAGPPVCHATSGRFVVGPADMTLEYVSGQPAPTLQFVATLNGTPLQGVVWSLDVSWVGSLDDAGLFTAYGGLGGTAQVTALCGSETAMTSVTVQIQAAQNGTVNDAGMSIGAGGYGGVGGNPIGGPVTPNIQQVLSKTPVADSGLSWLYPYDGTVWPVGTLPPLLQWQQGAHGGYVAVLLHLSEHGYDYQGMFTASGTPFVNTPIPPDIWLNLLHSNQGDPVTVSLTFAAGGKAYGPLVATWMISPDALPGTIYYQSYGTLLASNYSARNSYNGQVITFGAATLAINPGNPNPSLAAGNNSECRACHSGCANGSTLITQNGGAYGSSVLYNLVQGTGDMPVGPNNGQTVFPGIYPDGSMLLSSAVPTSGSPSLGFGSSSPSALFSLPGGTRLSASGLPASLGASLPAFSPDGTHVAFNFFSGTIGSKSADGRSLAVMDFDKATLTFSNPRVLFTPTTGTALWPSFLPNSNGVVFEVELQSNGRDYAGTRASCDTAGQACADTGTLAEIWWVDLASGLAHRLDNLNGVGLPSGPNGHTNDQELNYEPTVDPNAAGGYAWVAFTSRRMYGNIATINGFWSDPRYHDLTTSPTPKKLWVAPIDLNAAPGTDGSHPAFYLPGQELLAGNSRGFWGQIAKPPSQFSPGSGSSGGSDAGPGDGGPGDGG